MSTTMTKMTTMTTMTMMMTMTMMIQQFQSVGGEQSVSLSSLDGWPVGRSVGHTSPQYAVCTTLYMYALYMYAQYTYATPVLSMQYVQHNTIHVCHSSPQYAAQHYTCLLTVYNPMQDEPHSQSTIGVQWYSNHRAIFNKRIFSSSSL